MWVQFCNAGQRPEPSLTANSARRRGSRLPRPTSPRPLPGLSEIARRLGLAKPTTLGIVTTLSESGYLVRDSHDKTYRLGPSLITLGNIAQESMRVNPAARDELSRLKEFQYDGRTVGRRETTASHCWNSSGHPGGRRRPSRQSYPFAPPVGLMFVLWDDEALKSWLTRTPRSPSHRLQAPRPRRRRMPGRRLSGRAHDPFGASPLRADGRDVQRVARRAQGTPRRADLRHRGTGVSAQRSRDIQPRTPRRQRDLRPVYDHRRRQAMVLSLQIGRSLTDAQIGNTPAAWSRPRACSPHSRAVSNRIGNYSSLITTRASAGSTCMPH